MLISATSAAYRSSQKNGYAFGKYRQKSRRNISESRSSKVGGEKNILPAENLTQKAEQEVLVIKTAPCF